MSSSGNMWVVLCIQQICNTTRHKSPIYGLFRIHKRSQRDNKKTYNRITETLGNAMFSRVFCTVNWKSGSSLYETETINK